MATYTIIGGDQKQYGPITASDIRQWIAEGRLNAQSQAKAEGDTEFRALALFPEFTAALAPAAGSTVPPPLQPLGADDGGRAATLRKIKVPALGLMITAIINLILSVWGLISLFFFSASAQEMQELNQQLQQLNNPQLTEFAQKILHLFNNVPLSIASALLGMAMSVLILIGASKMRSLRSYEFSFTAAVLSVIPCLTPCCGFIVGIIFGIWALALLMKPGIKAQFK